MVLEEHQNALVSGLVGRIWTLRRDYPELSMPDEFRDWSERGTARVVFGHRVEPHGDGGSVLLSDARVQAIGATGSLGVAAVRPLVGSARSSGRGATSRGATRRAAVGSRPTLRSMAARELRFGSAAGRDHEPRQAPMCANPVTKRRCRPADGYRESCEPVRC